MAAESGLDAFIQWDMEFIGKASAEAERKAGPTKRLVPLVVDSPEIDGEPIDVSNDEAILSDGKAVGYVSSGGSAPYMQRFRNLHLHTAIDGNGICAVGNSLDQRAVQNRDPREAIRSPCADCVSLRSGRNANAELNAARRHRDAASLRVKPPTASGGAWQTCHRPIAERGRHHAARCRRQIQLPRLPASVRVRGNRREPRTRTPSPRRRQLCPHGVQGRSQPPPDPCHGNG